MPCQQLFFAAAAFRVWFVVTERIVVLVPGQSAITGDEDNASFSASDSGRLELENS